MYLSGLKRAGPSSGLRAVKARAARRRYFRAWLGSNWASPCSATSLASLGMSQRLCPAQIDEVPQPTTHPGARALEHRTVPDALSPKVCRIVHTMKSSTPRASNARAKTDSKMAPLSGIRQQCSVCAGHHAVPTHLQLACRCHTAHQSAPGQLLRGSAWCAPTGLLPDNCYACRLTCCL